MDTLKLYSYFRSSASYRVRIALNLKGLRYEQTGVHLLRDGGEQLSKAYRAVNPDGVVPSLIDPQVSPNPVTQSLAIIEYLDERFPQPPLLPASFEDRAFVRSVALQIACDIHPVNNLRVLKYLKATLDATDEQKSAWYAHWITSGFAALERRLRDDPRVGEFVCGDTPTLADICVVPQVWNARRFNVPLDAFPTLTRLADHAAQLPAFTAAEPSRQPDADTPQTAS